MIRKPKVKILQKQNSVVLAIMLFIFCVTFFSSGNSAIIAKEFNVKASDIFLNDPGFTANSLDIDHLWALPKAHFLESWEKTKGSEGNVVALIDTGVDETHVDLQSIKFVEGYDFISNTSILPGTNSDDNGHGTLIAGVLGATANNGVGVVGTNWKISIMPIKALDAQGNGNSTYVSNAIIWAADHGANIINLSLGGNGFSHDTQLAEAVSYAFKKNILLVAAGGNDVVATTGNLDTQPVFPICNDNGENMIIGVTAIDTNDIKPYFSNYGKICIDVAAPGKRILSTINHDPITGKYSPNSYAYASGTSLAVPFVAGQAALIWSLFPRATNKQVRDRIIASTENIDNLNLSQCNGSCRGLIGTGRINVFKSLVDPILPGLNDGELVQTQDGKIYYINGIKKQIVTSFVRKQRFVNREPLLVDFQDVAPFQEGPILTPLDGTLMKTESDPTVYFISRGLKLPITKQIFDIYHLNFRSVTILPNEEVDTVLLGSFLAPPDGTLVKGMRSRTLYWTINGTLHPISANFYKQRGLSVFPILIVPDLDLTSFSKGEAFF